MREPLASPTNREREVLALMAEGRSNQAIATRLYLNAKTVESHVRSVFTKRLGLLPEPDDHRTVLAGLPPAGRSGSALMTRPPSAQKIDKRVSQRKEAEMTHKPRRTMKTLAALALAGMLTGATGSAALANGTYASADGNYAASVSSGDGDGTAGMARAG